MLNVSLTAGNTVTSTPVGLTTVINTNNNLNLENNGIQILKPGIYEVIGEVTATSAASGDYGLNIMANGEQSGNSSISYATGASETTTMPLYTLLEIESTQTSGYATITLLPIGTPTIVGGSLSVKKIN